MGNLLLFTLFASMAATLIVLIAGMCVMARGGEVNKKYSNRLMQLRVMFQSVALASLVGIILLSQ